MGERAAAASVFNSCSSLDGERAGTYEKFATFLTQEQKGLWCFEPSDGAAPEGLTSKRI